MAKRTPEQKKKSAITVFNTDWVFEPEKKIKIFIYFLIVIIPAILGYYYISFALGKNGYLSFTLDDPWIHLTFARNLIDFHSFSYFKSEMVTAGSTSPIYTFIVALGFIFTNNEMVLSYILGILFLSVSGIAFYKLASFDFEKENVIAIIFVSVLLADKWLNFISVSGMETTMFIFILIAAVYFYKKRKATLFAVFLGLVLWGRPDGVAFIAAIAIDYLYALWISKTNKNIKLFTKNELKKIGIISGGIIIIYFIFNLILSGSILPNTYNAKLTYYTPEFRSRADFLKFEVWNYFTSGAYGFLAVGFFISVIRLLKDIVRKKCNSNLIYILFIIITIFIYWYKLPYAHRFGRYLMPLIPFIILSAGSGFRFISKLTGEYFKSKSFSKIIIILIGAIIIVYSFINYNENKTNYAEQCAYIHDRHVVTANWLKENTKSDEIIATHDVGAIGYYSGRKIIDVAGLITPGLIDKMMDKNYQDIMIDFLKKNGANYLVFQREWYRVVNQNTLYTSTNKDPLDAGDEFNVEVLDVYKFDPDKTHILSRETNSYIMMALNRISVRAPGDALPYLRTSAQLDPVSSYTYYISGIAYSSMGDNKIAEDYYKKGLEIFPDYKKVLYKLGNYYKLSNRKEDAKTMFERFLKISPDDSKVKELYKSVSDTQN
jgi:tetratricopeptide (TPR) repeat protein